VNKQPEMDLSSLNRLIEIEAEMSNLEDRTSRVEDTISQLLKLLAEAMRNDPNVNFQHKYATGIVELRSQWIKTA